MSDETRGRMVKNADGTFTFIPDPPPEPELPKPDNDHPALTAYERFEEERRQRSILARDLAAPSRAIAPRAPLANPDAVDEFVASQTLAYAAKDPSYRPYCGECAGAVRMELTTERFLWRCFPNGHVLDERGNADRLPDGFIRARETTPQIGDDSRAGTFARLRAGALRGQEPGRYGGDDGKGFDYDDDYVITGTETVREIDCKKGRRRW